jgi:5'-nucleotidase
VSQSSGKRVPIVQAYAFTKYLGIIELEFDKNGDLVDVDGSPIVLDSSIKQDVDVLQLLEKFRPGVSDLENEIVGSTSVFLDGNCRQNECTLRNFVADSMVDWYLLNYKPDVPIALLNGGGFRASIDHKANNGLITKVDVAKVFPFVNKISVVEVSGSDLIAALEHSVARSFEVTRPGEFLQFSGLRVVYDLTKPSGQRVKTAKVLPEYHQINESKSYKILTREFTANGGDGFDMFRGKIVETFETLEVDVFLEYLKKKSPVAPALDRRISFAS